MRTPNSTATFVLLLAAITGAVGLVAGCASGSYAAKGAGQGATTGALAGAVGAAATALIFGGNVGEAAARGAVYGGTSGAVVGGMSGASVDRQVAAQQAAEREKQAAKFRDEIGVDAFNGFVALAECKHEVAIANAREAQNSRNRDFALAGLWVEALAQADRNDTAAAGAVLPDIVAGDRKLGSVDDARARMDEMLVRLAEIRREYDLPASCGG